MHCNCEEASSEAFAHDGCPKSRTRCFTLPPEKNLRVPPSFSARLTFDSGANVSLCGKGARPDGRDAAEQLRPTRAKSRDAFLGKGSRTNGTASESLSRGDGGGGGTHAEWSGHGAKRARVEKIVRGMSGSPVGETNRDPASGPQERVAGAVTSTAVEALFQSVPLQQGCRHKAGAEWSQNAQRRSSGGNEAPGPAVQSQALALVVPRRGADRSRRLPLGVELGPVRTRGAVRRRGNSQFESAWQAEMDAAQKSAAVPSRVGSGSRRSPATAAQSTPLASVCFPRVNTEPRGLLHAHPYSLNEALTAEHLKKAKLMFFYTRYPSWRLLRLCFRDVQFTRRGASRLIKWFSNFREFYYIQVERFARRALAEGAADARALSVGRESQLFRVLKVHYDKGGHFQVPDGFLDVAELTLRQFYAAVSTGKDRDPSWKKAIYKVICKMDADLPAQFMPCGHGEPAERWSRGPPQRRRRLAWAF
ncbi:prospero homeobox protein 2-like [Hippocampus zosterae]|uniref:prospero homeobox protein 2-like n=1 Tax=Hippocampus zosterae TaxID=109293 RepID=UPI00223CB2C4|nr:prospero homeobox protein 2-like [Hippocampus zosterae]